jgi:prepilin-type N-terminal cleavage/methylation domain-containing protein
VTARRSRGFTLIEVLAVVALFGTIVLVTVQLVPRTWNEAEAFAAGDDAFHARWSAVRQLRADVERASSARVEEARLVLEGRERVTWTAKDGVLLRSGRAERRYAVATQRSPWRVEVAPRGAAARGTLVRWRIGAGEDAVSGVAAAGGWP